MAAANIYNPDAIASIDWWSSDNPVQPMGFRGWLVLNYTRFIVRVAGKSRSASDYLDDGFNWAKTRQALNRLESIPAVLPRNVHREATRIGDTEGEWFVAEELNQPTRKLIYVHGGSYIFPRSPLHDVLAANFSREAQASVYAIDYRLAPEHPFPCAIQDVVSAYREILASGVRAQQIGFIADSAGCGICLAALIMLREENDNLPAAFACLSPWADLTFSGASVIDNAKKDPYMSDLDFVSAFADLYLHGESPSHPMASPVLADLSCIPSTLVHVGSTDMFLDDSKRIVDNIRAHGGCARLDVWAEMPHVWQRMKAFCPEAECSLASMGLFLRKTVKTLVTEDE